MKLYQMFLQIIESRRFSRVVRKLSYYRTPEEKELNSLMIILAVQVVMAFYIDKKEIKILMELQTNADFVRERIT